MREIALFLIFGSLALAAESEITGVDIPLSPVYVNSTQPFVTINFSYYVSTPSTLSVDYLIHETGEKVSRNYSIIGTEVHSFHYLAIAFSNSTFKPGNYHITAYLEPLVGDTDLSNNYWTVNVTILGTSPFMKYFSIDPSSPNLGDPLDFYVSIANPSTETSSNISINNSTGLIYTKNIKIAQGFEKFLVLVNLTTASGACENFTASFSNSIVKREICPPEYMFKNVSSIPEYPFWAIFLFIGTFLQLLYSPHSRENHQNERI